MSYRIIFANACPIPCRGVAGFPAGSRWRSRRAGTSAAGGVRVWRRSRHERPAGAPLRRIPGEGKTAAGPSLAKPFQDLALAAKIRAVVAKYGADAVIAHNYEALLACLLAGVRPLIYHAHNAMSDELPYYFRWSRWPAKLGRWLDRTFPRRADYVIVPHQRLAGHLVVRGCDNARIAIVPPPLRAEDFEPCAPGDALPPVLYTGNLDAYQNLGLLFAAMERVRNATPSAALIATAEDAEFPDAEVVPVKGFDALHQILARDAVLALPGSRGRDIP